MLINLINVHFKDKFESKVTCKFEGTIKGQFKGKLKCEPYWTHPSLGGKNFKSKVVGFVGNHDYLKNVD